MSAYLIDILNQFGYIGISFLIAIENLFPPIPSEIILTFSGFMTLKSNLTPILVIIFATLGAVVGAIILYYIGHFFSEEKLLSLLDSKIGKMLGFKKESVHKTIKWFHDKGKYATLFGRCIPVIRSLISIPAGMAKMPFLQFCIYTTLGSLLWNTILVYLGVTMGNNWQDVVDIFNTYSNVSLFVIIIAVIIGFIYLLKRNKNK